VIYKNYNFCYDRDLIMNLCLNEVRRAVGDPKINHLKLKDLMERRGLSDGQLAEKVDMGRTTVYYLRTGKQEGTSEKNLKAIAGVLETTVDYLTGEGEVPAVSDGRVAMLLPEPVRKLAQIANSLPEDRQEELLRIASVLLDIERERAEQDLTEEGFQELLEIAEALRESGAPGDAVELLEKFVGHRRALRGAIGVGAV
jgi:transcriptional regulator with XRE-family HTH domain